MSGRPRVFRGIGASPGVAIGKVFLLDRGQVRIPRYHIQPEQIDTEMVRLTEAVAKSVEQLEQIRGRFVGGGMDHQSILEAHEMMLRDKALVDEAGALIRDEHLNAEWAISRVIARLRALFDQLSDPYLRERRGDIDFVGERILRNLVGQHADISELTDLGDATVVVARDFESRRHRGPHTPQSVRLCHRSRWPHLAHLHHCALVGRPRSGRGPRSIRRCR